jgi:hypothetical protein
LSRFLPKSNAKNIAEKSRKPLVTPVIMVRQEICNQTN